MCKCVQDKGSGGVFRKRFGGVFPNKSSGVCFQTKVFALWTWAAAMCWDFGQRLPAFILNISDGEKLALSAVFNS